MDPPFIAPLYSRPSYWYMYKLISETKWTILQGTIWNVNFSFDKLYKQMYFNIQMKTKLTNPQIGIKWRENGSMGQVMFVIFSFVCMGNLNYSVMIEYRYNCLFLEMNCSHSTESTNSCTSISCDSCKISLFLIKVFFWL